MVAPCGSWSDAPSQPISRPEPCRNYIRAKAAFCDKFVPINAMVMAQAKPKTGTAMERIPFNRMAPPQGVTFAGNGTVWQYLYKNMTCNLSAGIQVSGVGCRWRTAHGVRSVAGRVHVWTTTSPIIL